MKDKSRRVLLSQVEDKILEVANLYNKVTTSDLQGIATVKAREIIELVSAVGETIKDYSKALAAVKAASNMQELNEAVEKVETLYARGRLKMSDQEWVDYTNAIRNRAFEVVLE